MMLGSVADELTHPCIKTPLETEHRDKEKADYWKRALDEPGKAQQNLD
jgi:hypothetical protein